MTVYFTHQPFAAFFRAGPAISFQLALYAATGFPEQLKTKPPAMARQASTVAGRLQAARVVVVLVRMLLERCRAGAVVRRSRNTQGYRSYTFYVHIRRFRSNMKVIYQISSGLNKACYVYEKAMW